MSRQLIDGIMMRVVKEGSANDGKGDGHVLAKSGNQLVAKSSLRFQPRVLVNQTHRLQRHLKQDNHWTIESNPLHIV